MFLVALSNGVFMPCPERSQLNVLVLVEMEIFHFCCAILIELVFVFSQRYK